MFDHACGFDAKTARFVSPEICDMERNYPVATGFRFVAHAVRFLVYKPRVDTLSEAGAPGYEARKEWIR